MRVDRKLAGTGVALGLAALLAGAAPAVGAGASLCTAGETVVFSCGAGKTKTVSVCASPDLTRTEGYMQYRFGMPGKTPGLVYPATKAHPGSYFLSRTVAYAGGGAAYLKFTNGEYTYVVFTGIGRGWEKEGVAVENAGTDGAEKVAYLPCRGEWSSLIGPDFFEAAGLPEDPDEFIIPN